MDMGPTTHFLAYFSLVLGPPTHTTSHVSLCAFVIVFQFSKAVQRTGACEAKGGGGLTWRGSVEHRGRPQER